MTLLSTLLQDNIGSTNTTNNQTHTGAIQINNLNVGNDGTKGNLSVYPSTADKGVLKLDAQDNTNDVSVTINNAAHSVARIYSLQDVGANANIIVSEGNQLINGVKTFNSVPVGTGDTVSMPIVTITGLGGTAKVIFVATYNGRIVGGVLALEAAITISNITAQLRINSNNVTNGAMTIPFSGSGFGSNAACTPTAANTFVVGDVVNATITGGVGVGVGGSLTVYVVRTS